MKEAVRLYVRYDIPDEHGSTRRDRNEKHGISTPPVIVPDEVKHIWAWYFLLDSTLSRTADYVCSRILPSEFKAWRENMGLVVRPREYAMLCDMDAAYCNEMNEELDLLRIRRQQEAENKRGK